MKRQVFVMLGVLGAFSFAGCSSSSDSNSDICSRAYDATAEYLKRCGGNPPGDKARYLTTCQAQLNLPGISITSEWADKCFSAQAAAECGTDVSECEDPVGTLEDDAACSSDLQCAGGDCSGTDLDKDGTLTCGTCKKAKKSDSTEPSDTKKEDEECLVQEGTTSSYKPCEKGLYCDILDSKTCQPLLANGKACSSSIACKSGRCSEGKCASVGEEGDTCGGNGISSGGECGPGLGCDPKKLKCVARKYADEGEDCDNSLTFCTKGSCNGTSELDPETNQYVTTGTCPKVLKDGASCDTEDRSETCDDYASCLNGKCVLRDSFACVEDTSSKSSDSDTNTSGSTSKKSVKALSTKSTKILSVLLGR